MEKRRNRLKEFYGLQTPAIQLQQSSTSNIIDKPMVVDVASPVSPGDPMDINSRHFQAEQYVQRALKEQYLSSLLRLQCEMTTEIKTLDADMKSLVYENYEKFISANDTIKKMKFNVENMETELAKLSDQISKISSKSTKIHDSLNSRRFKIRQLGGRQSLLKKLQFVFELPSKLRECLNAKRYFDAACWLYKTQNIFAHYRDLAVFASLEKQTMEVVEELEARCTATIKDERASITEIANAIQCLLVIQKTSINTLWKELAKAASQTLRQSLSALKANKNRNSAFGDANQYFLNQFGQAIDLFISVFLARDTARNDGSIFFNQKRFSVKLANKPFALAQSDFDEFFQTTVDEYFRGIQNVLSTLNDENNRSLALKIQLTYLDQIQKQISEAAKENAAFEAPLLSRINRIISDQFTKITQYEFLAIKAMIIDRIISIDGVSAEGEAVNPLDEANSLLLKQMLPECVKVFLSIQESRSDFFRRFEPQFKNSIRGEMRRFWIDLLQELMKFSNGVFCLVQTPKQPNRRPVSLVLMLSLLCQTFASTSIAESYSIFTAKQDLWPEILPKVTEHGDNLPVAGKISMKSIENLIPEIIEIRDLSRKTGQKLTMRLIELAGIEIYYKINMHDLTGSWSAVLEAMRQLDSTVGRLIADKPGMRAVFESHSRNSSGGHRSSIHSEGGVSSSPNQSSSNFPRMSSFASTSSFAGSFISTIQNQRTSQRRRLFTNIDKIFSDKTEFYSGSVPDSRVEIVFSVLKIVLKAFAEKIRADCVIDLAGYQQFDGLLQYIRSNFQAFVADDKLFEMLLEEINQSASSRCIDEI